MGEQQKKLSQLMKTVVVPALPKPKAPKAPKKDKKKTNNKSKLAAATAKAAAARKTMKALEAKCQAAPSPACSKKLTAASKAADKAAAAMAVVAQATKTALAKKHFELGESESTVDQLAHEKPVELGEAEALEASDDAKESKEVEAAMKAESQQVAKNFASEQLEKEKVIENASVEAGKEINDKMAKEDAELLASDKDTDDSMSNIVGSQQQLESEQALYQGTMSPKQVTAAVDPEIGKIEAEDIESDNFKDNGFSPAKLDNAVENKASK